MNRIIGIRHRVKQTAKGEARPTQLCILSEKKSGKESIESVDLETETDELDWMLGRYPVEFRAITEEDDLAKYPAHHMKWKKLGANESLSDMPANVQAAVKKDGKIYSAPTKVPAAYDGLAALDTVAMTLGGSGDRFAFALSKQSDVLGSGTRVMRLPTAALKDNRASEKDDDAINLARLFKDKPEIFRECTVKDRALIRLSQIWRVRDDAVKDRIACEQRLRQRLLGKVFLTEDGRYPEGLIEDLFAEEKANDAILQALTKAQKKIEVDLVEVLNALPVYTQLFALIKGVGPMIATRLIVAIGDIRKFDGGEKHVVDDRVEAYRAEIRGLKELAHFDEDLDKVTEHLLGNTSHRREVQLVRSWKRRNGKEAEAALLDQALELYPKIIAHQRDVRRHRGPARLKAALGAHVLRGGRHGETNPGEQFPRHRTGERGNWSKEGRQALYLLSDQFNRRPESPWGILLLAVKAKLRKIHGKGEAIEIVKELKDLFRETEQFFHDHQVFVIPADNRINTTAEFLSWIDAAKTTLFSEEAIENREDLELEHKIIMRVAAIEAKLYEMELPKKPKMLKLYSNGHIKQMALWRTATKFTEWLFHAWMALENGGKIPVLPGRTIIAEMGSNVAPEESSTMSETTLGDGATA